MVAKLITILSLLLALTGAALGAWPSSGKRGIPCGGSVYYVSSVGNDANCGNSPSFPWHTIAHVNAQTLPANSTISFRGGDTFSGGLVFTTGVIASGLTINSYGTSGQATISSGNTTSCITAANIPNVTVNNIICTGGGNTTNSTDGILFTNTSTGARLSGDNVTNSTISQYGGMGIHFMASGTNALGFTNSTISNNVVHDNTGLTNVPALRGTACIDLDSSPFQQNIRALHTNITISNNTIHDCTGNANCSGCAAGFGILVENTTASLITGNLVHDNAALQVSSTGPVGIITTTSNKITISYNEVYNEHGSPADGEGIDFDFDTRNSVMEYNYVHDNHTAELALFGTFFNVYRFNVVETNVFGITLSTSTGGQGTQVYQNTFYASAGECFVSTGNAAAIQDIFANNICYVPTGDNAITFDSASSAVTTVTGNDYFSFPTNTTSFSWAGTVYSGLAAFQAGTGQEKVAGNPVGTTANPSLVGTVGSGGDCNGSGLNSTCPAAYKLQSGSAMDQAGLNLLSLYCILPGPQDFYGTSVMPPKLPIGAATITATSGTPTPCPPPTYAGPGDVASGASGFWGCTRAYNLAYATANGNLCLLVDAATGMTTYTLTALTTGDANVAGAAASAACATACVVKEMYDQTGNGNHMLQATLANMPAFTFNCTGFNTDKPCVTFNGTSDYLADASGIAASQPFTFEGVVSRTGNFTSYGHFLSCNDNTCVPGAGFYANVSQGVVYDGTQITFGLNDSGSNGLLALFNGASSQIYQFTDAGSGLNSGSLGSDALLIGHPLAIGALPRPTPIQYMTGFIGEVGVWPSNITSSHTNMCKNISSFYGFQLNLTLCA